MTDQPIPPDRTVELELLVTRLERDLDSLNAALVGQQKQIDDLRRQIERIDARVTGLGEQDEPRDPLAEAPPHY